MTSARPLDGPGPEHSWRSQSEDEPPVEYEQQVYSARTCQWCGRSQLLISPGNSVQFSQLMRPSPWPVDGCPACHAAADAGTGSSNETRRVHQASRRPPAAQTEPPQRRSEFGSREDWRDSRLQRGACLSPRARMPRRWPTRRWRLRPTRSTRPRVRHRPLLAAAGHGSASYWERSLWFLTTGGGERGHRESATRFVERYRAWCGRQAGRRAPVERAWRGSTRLCMVAPGTAPVSRLLSLDYVIERPAAPWLATEGRDRKRGPHVGARSMPSL